MRHLGEDARLDKLAHVTRGGIAQFGVAQAGVHLHHLAADLDFAHLSGEVAAIARVDPVAGFARDKPFGNRPDHEAAAGVATPERSVAVKDRDLWFAVQNLLLELLGGPRLHFHLLVCQSALNR